MIGVNLIPAKIMEAHRRSRRLRRWIVAVAIAGATAALPALWQLRQHARVTELTLLRSNRTTETAVVRADLAETVRVLAELNDRIEQANALRTKRPWAALLSVVAQRMPDEVWLTGMTSVGETAASQRQRLGSNASQKDSRPQVVVLDGARGLDLAGYAIGHEQLSDFMTGLRNSAAFDRVELVKANMENVLWSRAVRFELACAW